MNRLLCAAVIFVAASAVEARAQWGSLGYPTYYGRNVPPANFQDRMPYFAVYPPVYYSYPVPRPYGYSPFAYPGRTMTPQHYGEPPQTIINPYVVEEVMPAPAQPQQRSNDSSTERRTPSGNRQAANRSARATAPAPLRIVNPHAGKFVAGESR